MTSVLLNENTLCILKGDLIYYRRHHGQRIYYDAWNYSRGCRPQGKSRKAEDDSLAAQGSTEFDSDRTLRSNPLFPGNRGEISDASKINCAGGSNSKGRNKRRRNSKFSGAEDENLVM